MNRQVIHARRAAARQHQQRCGMSCSFRSERFLWRRLPEASTICGPSAQKLQADLIDPSRSQFAQPSRLRETSGTSGETKRATPPEHHPCGLHQRARFQRLASRFLISTRPDSKPRLPGRSDGAPMSSASLNFEPAVHSYRQNDFKTRLRQVK